MIVCALVLFELQALIWKLRDALRFGCVRFSGVVVKIAFAVDALPLWTTTIGACPGADPRRTGLNRAMTVMRPITRQLEALPLDIRPERMRESCRDRCMPIYASDKQVLSNTNLTRFLHDVGTSSSQRLILT